MLHTCKINADGHMKMVSPNNGRKFTLQECREAVNGVIDIIKLESLGVYLVINDEGLLLDLPVNKRATLFYQQEFNSPDQIHGDVLIAQLNQID